ncbi:3-phosphoserine/phosphohydroxythreonine transaminase [Candidatus Parcubacteria bacterium]|nr:3-phosphoserine/phosphohydroxythreonine transaminase [Candidatus Parcubacteria bacterium]
MRVFNFSAGPAVLPEPVLKQAAEEMLDWRGHGMNVMEMSHRSKEFIDIAAEAEADLRELMDIPLNYRVLFLQGGATGQFAAIPMNITKPGDKADYAITGNWSKKATQEAKKYLEVNVAVKTDAHTHIPKFEDWEFSKDAKYVHITPNETIHGVAYNQYPNTGDVPLIGDVSSMILSQPIDVSKFAVLYAGAQKNIGPAGITVVIIREDLLGQAREDTPIERTVSTGGSRLTVWSILLASCACRLLAFAAKSVAWVPTSRAHALTRPRMSPYTSSR